MIRDLRIIADPSWRGVDLGCDLSVPQVRFRVGQKQSAADGASGGSAAAATAADNDDDDDDDDVVMLDCDASGEQHAPAAAEAAAAAAAAVLTIPGVHLCIRRLRLRPMGAVIASLFEDCDDGDTANRRMQDGAVQQQRQTGDKLDFFGHALEAR